MDVVKRRIERVIYTQHTSCLPADTGMETDVPIRPRIVQR
jgi:hypothetical protein